MKKIKVTAVLFLLVFALSACKSYYESLFRTQDLEERFRGAMYFYNNGKFRKAASLFESMLFLSQGTDKEDSVQFYNALSNYRYGDYITAEANFNKFLEVFPRSAMSEEAKFLRIKCLYEGTYRWELDQVPTQKAMATIAEFMYDNPSSEYYDVCKAMMDEFGESGCCRSAVVTGLEPEQNSHAAYGQWRKVRYACVRVPYFFCGM